ASPWTAPGGGPGAAGAAPPGPGSRPRDETTGAGAPRVGGGGGPRRAGRRLHGRPRLQAAGGGDTRELQGERGLEGGRATRPCAAWEVVGDLRRPPARLARGAGERGEPEPGGGRGHLSTGARPGAPGPRRLLPDDHRRRPL